MSPSGNSDSNGGQEGTSAPLNPPAKKMTDSKNADSIVVKDGRPATDMVTHLLQSLAGDLASCKRYPNSTKAVIQQSNLLYEGILSLIEKVDKAKDTLEWDAFMKYTEAVGPLERFLLTLVFEGHGQSAIPPSDGLNPSIQFMKKFYNDRENISKVVTALSVKEFEGLHTGDLKSAIITAQQQDDIATLKELAESITSNPLKDSDIEDPQKDGDVPKYVTNVRERIKEVKEVVASSTYVHQEDRAGKIAFGVMLVYIPFLVSQLPSLDAKTDEHIKSAKLWKEIEGFVDFLKTFASDNAQKVSELDSRHEALEKKILEIVELGPITAQLISLMKLAAQVRRPLYGRSTALIQMWNLLNNGELLKEDNVQARKATRSAFMDTRRALEKAIKLLTSVDKDMSSVIQELEPVYASVLKKLEPQINKYANGNWDKFRDLYTTAESIDKEHLKLFHEKIAKKGGN